jgi:hypothetical protein
VRARLLVAFAAVVILTTGCGGPPRKAAAGPSTGSPATDTPSPVSPSATPGPVLSSPPASLTGTAGCPIFPADNVWHADVSRLPVHPRSAGYVASIGATRPVHPDFGSGLIDGRPWGIPVTAVPAGQAPVPVSFDEAGESDKGPYLLPRNALIEGGPGSAGDRHVIGYDPTRCRAYELYAARPTGSGWHAYSGAVWDLRANRMRPAGWTSADAAGLSILAGLVRYDEVAAGHVDHAIRMTVQSTQRAYVWPGSHRASSNTDPNLPPMGLRLRLKSTVDTSRMPPQARVVAEALKRYGAIIADNGSPWFFSGTQDPRWNNSQLDALKKLHGSDFEVVDESGLMVSPTSYQVH